MAFFGDFWFLVQCVETLEVITLVLSIRKMLNKLKINNSEGWGHRAAAPKADLTYNSWLFIHSRKKHNCPVNTDQDIKTTKLLSSSNRWLGLGIQKSSTQKYFVGSCWRFHMCWKLQILKDRQGRPLYLKLNFQCKRRGEVWNGPQMSSLTPKIYRIELFSPTWHSISIDIYSIHVGWWKKHGTGKETEGWLQICIHAQASVYFMCWLSHIQ